MAEGIKTLNFNILTSNNYNTKYISCGSDNNNIATVDYTGNDGGVTITAVSEGNTNIKFYTNSGHLIKSIPVNVYNKFEYSPLECIEFTYPTVSQFGTSDWITPIIKTSQTNLTTGKTNIKTYRNTLHLMGMGETISPNGDSWARISQMAAVQIYHKLNEGDPDQIYTVNTDTSCGKISAEIRQTYKPIDHGTLKITNLKYEDAEYDGGLHVSFEGNEQITPVMFKPIWANWELQVYFEDDTNETIDCSSWDAQKYEKDGYYGWHSSTITCSFALDKEYDFIESFNPLSGAILFKENTSTKQRTCNVLMTATIYGVSTTISITVKQNGNPNGTDSETESDTQDLILTATNVPTSVNNQSSSNIILTTNGPATLKLGTLNDQGNKIVYESDKFVGTGYVCQITQTGGTNHIIRLLNGMTGSLNINIVTNKIRVQATPVDSTQYEMTANSYWKNTNPIKIIGKNTITNNVTINEPERIDLKLESGTIWCSSNLMANDPADIGRYFAWGEILPKSTYNWETYKYCNGTNTSITKYCFDNDIWAGEGEPDQKRYLDKEDDPVRQLLGDNWRTPLPGEYSELQGCPNKNLITKTYNNKEVKGFEINRIFGYPSMFIPIAGYAINDEIIFNENLNGTYYDRGFYWSRDDFSESLTAQAWKILIRPDNSGTIGNDWEDKCNGYTIRPVWVSENASYPEPEPDNPIDTTDVDNLEHDYLYLETIGGLLYSTTNLGASSPEEFGNMISWGEIYPKSKYTESNYKFYKNGNKNQITKYCSTADYWAGEGDDPDNLTKLKYADDAVFQRWGTDWRLPSVGEISSLLGLPNSVEIREVNGKRIIGVKIGNRNGVTPIDSFLFLPVAEIDERGDLGTYTCYYWGSDKLNDTDNKAQAMYIKISNKKLDTFFHSLQDRHKCYMVRPMRMINATTVAIFTYILNSDNQEVTNIQMNVHDSIILHSYSFVNRGSTREYATYQDVTWSSDGKYYGEHITYTIIDTTHIKVTAISEGTNKLSCRAKVRDYTYHSGECTITVICNNEPEPEPEPDTPIEPINIILPTDIPKGNIKAVDLNLPSGTLWANMNVGAVDRADIGRYFAWGELQPKSSYSWSNYKYCNGTKNTITKYCTDASIWAGSGEPDGLVTLQNMDDIVKQLWGPEWKMPTGMQLAELNDINHGFTYVEYNGKKVYGAMFYKRGTPNESLFLPITGTIRNDKIYNDQDMTNSIGNGLTYPCGFYWSTDILGYGTLNGIDYHSDSASELLIYSNPNAPQQAVCTVGSQYRCYGMAIRPVHV